MSELKIILGILPAAQLMLWEELSATPPEFVLYGGTAIALQLGHRESIDFDFFSHKSFEPEQLYESISYLSGSEIIGLDKNTLTCLVRRNAGIVQCSYFGGLSMQCIELPIKTPNGIKIAPLLDLFATKCATVQKRAEWKDYTDIVTILNNSDFSLAQGISAACTIFGEKFVPLSSLKALSYTKDLVPQLNSEEEQVLQSKIREADLGSFQVYKSIGFIGASESQNSNFDGEPGL